MKLCISQSGTLLTAAILVLGIGCRADSRPSSDAPRVDSTSSIILEEALSALHRADFSAAMGLVEGVEERQPGLVEAQYVKGQIYYDLRLYDEAEAHWRNVLESEPDYWLWWQNLGDVVFHKEEFRKSADYYRRAAELDENPLAWHGLAGAYWELGQPDSAADALHRAVEADSLFAPVYLSLSNLAEERGDLEEAYALARRAVRLDPGSQDARLAAGVLGIRLGRFEEATGYLEPVLESEPWNVTALYNLGLAKQRAGRADEARELLDAAEEARSMQAVIDVRQDAIRSNPRNPANYMALAEVLHDAGRLDDALRAYKTVDLMVPPDPHLRHTIATLQLEMGEYMDAIIRYHDVMRRDSTFVEAWVNLGIAYARMNQVEQARGIWKEASRRFPNDATVAEMLTRLQPSVPAE